MPTIQKPFEDLAHLCASLEIIQSQDYTLRSQVDRIKELCITLLKTPPDIAEKTLQQLPILLKRLPNKIANETLLKNLIEMKYDTSACKELHARLISMEEYGLAGDEDEDTKAQMRIDAFNEAINNARIKMKAPSAPQVTFKMHTGPSFFASDTIHSPELTELSPSVDDMLYKRKEGESESVISDKEKAAYLEAEQKSLRNEKIYRDVFDDLRPANLTMLELCSVITHEYRRINIIFADNPNNPTIKAFERIYFKKSVIELLEKKIISYQESIDLFMLFNQHNDSLHLRESAYAIQHEKLNKAIFQLASKKIISYKEAANLLNYSDNLVSETKNEPPKPTGPR